MEEEVIPFKRAQKHKPVLKVNFNFDNVDTNYEKCHKVEEPTQIREKKEKFQTNQNMFTINSKFSTHKTLISIDLSSKNLLHLHNVFKNDIEPEDKTEEDKKDEKRTLLQNKSYIYKYSWVESIRK